MPKISGDVATLLGSDHNVGDPVALWVEPSQPITMSGSTGLVGGKVRIDVADDGTFTTPTLPATVGVPLYRLIIDSRSLRRAGNPRGMTTKWFPLEVDRDLTWVVANYVDVVAVSSEVEANIAAAAALGATNDTATASFVNNGASATSAALKSGYASVVTPEAHGNSLAAAIAAAQPGDTVLVRGDITISEGITITTNNLTLASPKHDIYAASIRGTTPGMTMFTVKAAGFNASVHLIGDGGDRGQGATINGFDLYGTAAGDVDTELSECSFVYMAQPVRARGRNLKVDGCLFSNCRGAVRISGNDATYHVGDASSKVCRGIRIGSNRYHAVGATSSDAAILFDDTIEDMRHAEVAGGYVDMFGRGRFCVARGIAGRPLKGLVFRAVEANDALASMVDWQYVQDGRIISPVLLGSTSADSAYDAIVLDNCTVTHVVTPTISRPGRSGIVATNCTDLRIVEPFIRQTGIEPGATGHGMDINSTNTTVEIIEPNIAAGDGWAITGSPASSSLVGGSLAGGLGTLNSTTLRRETVTVAGADLVAITGTPTTSNINSYACMMLDAATTEQVTTMIRVPAHWTTYDIEVIWCSTTNAAGDVRLQLGRADVAAGASLPSGSVTSGTLAVTTGAANMVHKWKAITSGAVPPDGLLGLRIIRDGSNAADTYASDVGIVAVRLVRAA